MEPLLLPGGSLGWDLRERESNNSLSVICTENRIWESGYVISESGHVLSESGYVISESGHVLSEFGYVISESGYVIS